MDERDPLRLAARGAALLKQGDYRAGFPLFDRYRHAPDQTNCAPALPFPTWRGQDVAGKRILIWGEHGFGDQIMYARFGRILAQQGGDVSWLCDPTLVRLFESSLGVTVLPGDRPHDLRCDYYCPSSALPLAFDLTVESIPNAAYLSAPPLPGASRIGLKLWGGTANPARSLEPGLARRLAEASGGVDLDPEATGAVDFFETAQRIAALDLVISVDTSVAHLAGAMGKPVWILLPYDADWRWLTGRTDSPWYPSAKLFRQDATCSWAPVVERVVAELANRS